MTEEIDLYLYAPNLSSLAHHQNYLSPIPPHHWSMQSLPYRCIAVIKGQPYPKQEIIKEITE